MAADARPAPLATGHLGLSVRRFEGPEHEDEIHPDAFDNFRTLRVLRAIQGDFSWTQSPGLSESHPFERAWKGPDDESKEPVLCLAGLNVFVACQFIRRTQPQILPAGRIRRQTVTVKVQSFKTVFEQRTFDERNFHDVMRKSTFGACQGLVAMTKAEVQRLGTNRQNLAGNGSECDQSPC